MVAAPRLRFTFKEYLSVDERSEAKHEFLDGMILAMAGGTPEHARLVMAIGSAFSRQLEGRRCAVFSEALRVRSIRTGFAGYPDVTVVCDGLEADPEDRNTVTNPTAVVEVLSPSTADYDRGAKLRSYQQIASLRHVVLVAHDAVGIQVWTREAEGWTERTFHAGERAELMHLSLAFDVDQIYRDPLVA